MRVKDKALVLKSIKHGENKRILKIFTRNHGLITVCAYPTKSGKGRIRRATLQPMSLIEIQISLKRNEEIHQMNEASLYFIPDENLHSLLKNSMIHFLNEVLLKVIREHYNNPDLFDFVETSVKYIDHESSDFENFHIYFLIELSRYLGVSPQNNFSAELSYFNLLEGKFSSTALLYPQGLDAQESILFSEELRKNTIVRNNSNANRKKILSILLTYYRLHIHGFNELKSLEVIRELLI